MDATTLRRLRRDWRSAWPGADLVACSPDGTARHGRWLDPALARCAPRAIEEGRRWGEPAVVETGGWFCWAVPLTDNAQVVGGLVAVIAESALFPSGLDAPAFDMRQACTALRELAESVNATNPWMLAQARELHERERQRAAFLHALKRGGLSGLTATYLNEEAALLAAVRVGDRGRARAIINRMLTAIYHRAAGSVEATKALLLELVVLVLRTAVESGGRRDVAHAAGLDLLAVGAIDDHEGLARWLRRSLETIFDAVEGQHRCTPDEELFRRALAVINQRCDQPLDRDTVAEAVGVSPPRLTRLIRTHAGRGFTDLLNRARIDRARDLLDHGMPAHEAATEAGFADASYFTKVFRRLTGSTPSAYRDRAG